jgi:hypothetical protein
MKKSLLSLVAATVVLVGCATQPPQGAAALTPSKDKWTCTAPGLVSATYTGGKTAFVHLSGFSSGGYYNATQSADGKSATGKTQNGTAFTCIKT